MDKILIVGLDTIAGANLAAVIKERYVVNGLCWESHVSVTGCTTETESCDEALPVIQRVRPDRILFCSPASELGWDSSESLPRKSELVHLARTWAEAAARTNTPLTVLSSSSIFTGPWMFHDEDSTQFCSSPEANAILAVEKEFQNRVPTALIVRTHLFGWSPLGEESGYAAALLDRLRIGESSSIDCIRHASPILATDLAEILEQTFTSDLIGLIHIGGAERINPYRFATMLADQFGYPCSVTGTMNPVGNREGDFGAGESSLNCRRVRNELEIGLPLAVEGIQRFYEQSLTDFRDQFQVLGRPTRNLVA